MRQQPLGPGAGFLAAVAAAAALVAAAGCYNPKIEEGAFSCPSGSCPSGFSCTLGKCYKNAPARADAGADGACQQNERECSPVTNPSGACDPVCQSGCGSCSDKCTNNGAGNVCVAATVPAAGNYDSCSPDRDTCTAGAVCLGEFNEQKCGAHCYRFCRVDSDCKGPAGNQIARCTGEAQNASGDVIYKHCSPRIETCNPAGPNPRCQGASAIDRPSPAFACYMLSWQHPDESVCECAGTLPDGAPCSREYECVPGHECLKVGTDTRCRKLCTPDNSPLPSVGCAIGQRCTPFPNGLRLGYCAPL
jgi:hypothetical protein